MTIKGKIFLVLGLIFVVTAATMGVIVNSLRSQGPGLERTETEAGRVADHAVALLVTIKEIKADVIQVQGWLTDISATRGYEGFDDGFTEAEGFARKFAADLEIARGHADALELGDVGKALDGMAETFPPFYAGGKKMAQAYIDGGPEAGNPMMEEFDTVAAAMGDATDNLVELVQGEATAILDGLEATAAEVRDGNDTLVGLIGMASLVLAIVILGGMGILFVVLSRSFDDLQADVQVLLSDKGGATFRMASDRRDEFGPVARAFALFQKEHAEMEALKARQEEEREQATRERREERLRLADGFESTVGRLVAEVSSAAGQMQATAQGMSETAVRTSQRSTSAAAASEQASTNVQTVASAAEQLSGSINEISRQVSQSNQIATTAVQEVQQANTRVQGLADSASRIGEVVALITDIANQTNLLALNATIEAARAGDAGKGFAVVASEVKNLATQTAKATEEIAGQVTGIQTSTQEAVAAIGDIGRIVSEVNEIAASIAAAVEEQGAATNEIARNVEQAASGTNEVSTNIQGVTEAADETGAASGQVLTAAEELGRNSDTLKAEVGKFLDQVRSA